MSQRAIFWIDAALFITFIINCIAIWAMLLAGKV